MELGICVRNTAIRDVVELGRFAEDHGFSEVYLPDGARGAQLDPDGLLTGRDAFCGLAALFTATTRLRGGIGVAATPLYQPMTLALLAATLQEASEGRFSLGVGVSHPELLSRHGVAYPDHPVAYMRGWLDELRRQSTQGVSFGGHFPVLLAALGPRMVELGAAHADGLVLNWLTPEHAPSTVDAVRRAAPPGTRPRTVLYLRLMPAEAALRDAVNYDALGNYHRHFVNQGLHDSAAIVRGTTLPLDDLGAARARIAEYEESGIDLLCVYPHDLPAPERNAALSALTR
jgi:alkanesulfonate monooxygenase SsuD/methylene tetrahydromethanopterin reductase-like flavin-dependent oxidoreductase (luciferase family)